MNTLRGILPQVSSIDRPASRARQKPIAPAASGLPSVCSADRFVLEAAIQQAVRDQTVVLIESTCNQVNQFGGYTGMRPADFRALVAEIAARQGYSVGRAHPGRRPPRSLPWRNEPAAQAMAKARELVRAYVPAGYTKIHLDCSMRLADDPGVADDPLSDETATARTAELATVAEAAWGGLPAGHPAPFYVIGTEVPTPGGEQAATGGPVATSAAHARRTRELCEPPLPPPRSAAWERVVALVVQPGVEFGEARSTTIAAARGDRELSQAVVAMPHLVYEAHSTDYQTRAALRALVEDHFAVLKVGPALTFALREALFALAAIETSCSDARQRAGGRASTGAAGRALTQAPARAPTQAATPSRCARRSTAPCASTPSTGRSTTRERRACGSARLQLQRPHPLLLAPGRRPRRDGAPRRQPLSAPIRPPCSASTYPTKRGRARRLAPAQPAPRSSCVTRSSPCSTATPRRAACAERRAGHQPAAAERATSRPREAARASSSVGWAATPPAARADSEPQAVARARQRGIVQPCSMP